MNTSKQIRWGALMSYGIIIFNIVIGLLYTPWMISKIGRSDYGLYILVTTFLTYFTVDYGLSLAVNKTLSICRAEHKREDENKIIGVATRIYFSSDLVILAVLMIVYFFIDKVFHGLSEQEIYKFQNIYIIASFFSILSFPFGFLKGVFSAYEYFVEQKFYEFLNKIGTILVTIILLYFNFGLYALVIAFGIIPFILNISKTVFLYKKGIRLNFVYWDKKIAKQMFTVSGWLLVIVLAELFVNNVSPSLIAMFSNTDQIAIFSIGFTLYGYIYTFANSINGLFLPRVSQMYVEKKMGDIEILTFKIGRLQLLFTGFLILGIILLGKSFIVLWVGHTFLNSYYVAVFLIIPPLITNMQQIESTLLFVMDKMKYKSIMLIFMAISSIIMSIILTPKFGAIGTGCAICVANFIFMIIGMNIVYVYVTKYNIWLFIKNIAIFLLSYLSIALLFLFFNEFIIASSKISWFNFILQGIAYTVIYLLFMYFIVINSYEKKMLNKILNKIRRCTF